VVYNSDVVSADYSRDFRKPKWGSALIALWFANLILYSAALTLAGYYVPFTDIGSAVMKILADTRGTKIDEKERAVFHHATHTARNGGMCLRKCALRQRFKKAGRFSRKAVVRLARYLAGARMQSRSTEIAGTA
jgi:hypothetical protein